MLRSARGGRELRVLGIKTARSEIDWVVLEGRDRQAAEVVDAGRSRVPAGHERSDELSWIRREVIGLLDKHEPDAVAVMTTEPGGQNVSVHRAEVDGVVQEACASAQRSVRRLVAASVRSSFRVRSRADLDEALETVPALYGVPKSRQAPVVSALCAMPTP